MFKRRLKTFPALFLLVALVLPLAGYAKKTNSKDLKNQKKSRQELVEWYKKHGLDLYTNLIPTGKTEEDELRLAKSELLADVIRDRAIDSAKELIKVGPPKLKAELRSRMGKLYMEKGRTAFLKKLYKIKTNQKGKHCFSQKECLLKALSHYQIIEKRYPRYKNLDSVRFNSGIIYQDLGKPNNAYAYFGKVIHYHPKSKLAPNAYLAQGEIKFNALQFDVARAKYKAVLSGKDSSIKPYARYRLAWCHFNLNEINLAMKEMRTVIRNARAKQDKENQKIELFNEAANDYVLFYAEVGNPGKAYAEFKGLVGSPKSSDMIMKLINQYNSHSKFKNMVLASEPVLKTIPSKVLKPEEELSARQYVLIAWERLEKPAKVIKEVKNHGRFLDTAPPEIIKSRGFYESSKLIREVASSYHNKGNKKSKEKFLRKHNEALQIYSQWIRQFENYSKRKSHKYFQNREELDDYLFDKELANASYWPVPLDDLAKVNVFLGELFYRKRDFLTSAQFFEKGWRWDKDGDRAVEAAYARVVSLENFYKEWKPSKKGINPKSWQRAQYLACKDFKKPEGLLSYAYQDYMSIPGELIKDKKRKLDVEFLLGKLHHDSSCYQNSEKILAGYLDKVEIGKQKSLDSIQMISYGLEQQRKWDQLVARVESFLDRLPSGHSFMKNAKNMVEGAKLKKIEEIQKKGKHEEAAKKYLAFSEANPESQYAFQSRYNAAVEILSAKKPNLAIEWATPLTAAKTPKDIRVASYELIIEASDQMLDAKQGAKNRLRYAGDPATQREESLQALKDSANLAIQVEDWKTSQKALEQMDRKSVKDSALIPLVLRHAHLLDYLNLSKNFDNKEAIKFLEKLSRKKRIGKQWIDNPTRGEISFRVGVIHERLDQQNKAEKFYRRAHQYLSPKGPLEKRRFGAQAALFLAEKAFQKYKSFSFSEQNRNFMANVKRKTNEMRQVIAALNRATSYRIAKVNAVALTRIAEAYYDCADTIRSAAVPPNMPEAQIANYRQQLKQLALPLEQKSQEAWTNATHQIEISPLPTWFKGPTLPKEWVQRAEQKTLTPQQTNGSSKVNMSEKEDDHASI